MKKTSFIMGLIFALWICPLNASATMYQIYELNELTGVNSFESVAYDINDHGQIVGYDRYLVAFFYDAVEDRYVNLTSLDGNGWSDSAATGINNNGEIVGWTTLAVQGQFDSRFHYDGNSFSYSDIDSSNLGDPDDGPIYDINENGHVVSGHIGDYDGPSNLIDLIPEDSGWTSLTPKAINNDQWIVGYGSKLITDAYSFPLTGFLMKPVAVPEPSLGILLGIGVLGIGFIKRRFKKN
jgi:uncharacterized membrane protein